MRVAHDHAVNNADPLEPQVYVADVPFVAPSSVATPDDTTVTSWLSRAPGSPVPWRSAVIAAVLLSVVLALAETLFWVTGGASLFSGLYAVAVVWAKVHLSGPRHRWWAFGAALIGFAILETVSGAPLPRVVTAYLEITIVVVVVFLYTAVTHAPQRARSVGAASIDESTQPPMTAGQARRAAGTVHFADNMRLFFTDRPARLPARDLIDLRHGATLYVSAWAHSGRRFRPGRLVLNLDAPQPVTWQRHRLFRGYGRDTALPEPHVVGKAGPVSGPGSWNVTSHLRRLITVRAGDQLWDLAVPTVDLRLLRTMMGTERPLVER